MTTQGAQAQNEVVVFFNALTQALHQHEGQLTKETYLNAAMLAATKISASSRDALLTTIAEQPATLLTNLNKTREEKASGMQLVSAPAAFAMRKYGLDFMKKKGIPYVMNIILPGGGIITEEFVIPAAEIAGEYAIEICKSYLQDLEKLPTKTLCGYMNQASKGFFNLFGRAPIAQAQAVMPALELNQNAAIVPVQPRRSRRASVPPVMQPIYIHIAPKRVSTVTVEEIKEETIADRPRKAATTRR